MPEFKTVKVNISFEISVLQEDGTHQKPTERAMEDVLDHFSSVVGRFVLGKNYAISPVTFSTECENKICRMTERAAKIMKDGSL